MKKMALTLCLVTGSWVLFAQNTTVLSVYFDSNSSRLRASDSTAIRNFLTLPDSIKPLALTLTGSCDDVGKAEHNVKLAAQRISSVRNLLNVVRKDSLPVTEVNRGSVLMVDVITDTMAYRAANRKVVLSLDYAKNVDKLVDSELTNASLKLGERIALNNILFEGGSSEFLPESNASLTELFDMMQSNPGLKVCILGHVCCTPPDRDGIDLATGKYGLSVFRAQAVYNYLVRKGIGAERLSYKGLGASEPTGKGDRYDRRVEIEITANGK